MEISETFQFVLSAFFLLLVELLYFRIARRYNIVDHPNERSSHTLKTLRGGGIIFPVGMLVYFVISNFTSPYFVSGLILISLISFYDDLRTLSYGIRISFHLAAVSLLLVEFGLFQQPVWIIAVIYIMIAGTINAYNFMDGINGITGVYSFAVVLTLLFINEYIIEFATSGWLIMCAISLLIFIFFNVRQKAICFAGDIGSVSIAFIIIFFLASLIIKSGEIKYTGLLFLYGLDTVTTIFFRLIRRENIFLAHRTHFYQHLVNERKWAHVRVAMMYASVQLFINHLILSFPLHPCEFISVLVIGGLVFVVMRLGIEGKTYLLRPKA